MKFFKNKKQITTKPKDPRAKEEIEREYSELKSRAGETQYLAMVYEKTLANINARMLEINYEAEARKKLDNQINTSEGTSNVKA